ncbi:MAG: efflux RND transporter periplasmic adaptor subunit [Acidobacteriaceae bacterium]|nr:efflux RND transporter periplasmic adaptor subunit [Acidobacteriaceae bacterium]
MACTLSLSGLAIATVSVVLLGSCTHADKGTAQAATTQTQTPITVGVNTVTRHSLQRQLTVSSELVPFQEIDVYAKEAGYVSKLLVDYGSHVSKGQLLAVLEIPELEAQLQQDQAAIKSMADQVTNAQNQLSRVEAQHKVVHLEYERLSGVAQSKPGLVAQQEVDDLQGRDLAAEAQVEAGKSNLEAARSNLAASQAKLTRDQAIYSYSRITAPFAGVVTQRYANLGTLLQAGTNSQQAMPLVKLSEEDLYRLVIPIPETYVGYVKVGDPVNVRVPALNDTFPGKVARFSADVHDATRTMHTEVDVPNPKGALIPGVYAEATLTMNKATDALTVPIQAVDREGEHASVLIVDSNNQIQARQVELGVETANEAEILSGLQEGDRVVVSDRAGLKTGEPVRPQATPPPTYQSRS